MNEWNNENGYAWTRTHLAISRASTLSRDSTHTRMKMDCHYVERRLATPSFVHRLKGARHANALDRRFRLLTANDYSIGPPYEHPPGLEAW